MRDFTAIFNNLFTKRSTQTYTSSTQPQTYSLSDLAATGTYTAQEYRQGASEVFVDLENVFGIDTGDWERYNIQSVSIDIQKSSDNGGNWEDIDATGFQGLLPTEYHLNTTEALSDHRFGFRIFENVIDDEILYNDTNRLRFLVAIEDNNMAEITRYIPFSALSGVDLSSFNHTTVFSAITVREGGATVDIDLVAGLFQIDSWSDVHWSAVTAAVQQSADSGQNWADQTAEFQGLAVSERTLTTTSLLSDGDLSIALGADTIPTDILHDDTNRMRILVTMSDGTHTRFVAIPVSFRAPLSLSDLTAIRTSAAQEFRQGAAATNLSYTNLFDDITDISDYNIKTASVKVQRSSNNGQTWEDMDSSGFQGLLPTEYTLTTTSLMTALQFMFRIHENAIQSEILHDGQNRLRFLLAITD